MDDFLQLKTNEPCLLLRRANELGRESYADPGKNPASALSGFMYLPKNFAFMSRFLLFILLAASPTLALLAQEARVMTAADYEAAKTLRIENLERDTYVVFDEPGYILDRYELRPAYVFTFSDSMERRLYLYLLYPLETEDTLGFVLFYHSAETDIALPIPGPGAERAAWSLYIDDLKYTGEDHPGFLPTVSFVISRELAGLLQGVNAPMEESGEYEYCFPAQGQVTLADGSLRPIADIRPGDRLWSWSESEQQPVLTTVTGVDRHERNRIPLLELGLVQPAVPLASQTATDLPLHQLLCTANHPLQTANGPVAAGDLRLGDELLLYQGQQVVPVQVAYIRSGQHHTTTVYSLQTQRNLPFWVDGVLVLPK